ncbi:hypothetical protein ACIOHE_34820 [Streptomyces sp. NPDC087851]|uniref:hypothetical protein n=1 Tax=Streptomyces sp. NPDC087851 TaxID=3365810 RepID=UPI00382ACFC2
MTEGARGAALRTRLRRFARREWGPLLTTVRTALSERGPRAVPMTLAAVGLTALFQVAQNQPWGYRPVMDLGAVRAEDPLGVALLRTPLSLFVPALDLPVWGALAQILLVFGVAEICLGRRRTLLIAYVATLAGTLYARIGVALGPQVFPGLPASDAEIVDTGPSAAVVGLALFLCRRHRAWWTAGALLLALIGECLVKDNLAGREHLAASAAVLALIAVLEHRERSRHRRRARRRPRPGLRRGVPYGWSGVPPIQSWTRRRGPAQRRSRR